MKEWTRVLAWSAAAALALTARPAHACGGPDMGDFAALAPFDETLGSILSPDDEDGMAAWGQEQRPEFRFLYPAWKAHPRELDSLWRFSYGDEKTLPGPDAALPGPRAAQLDAALSRGDVSEAARQAGAIVEAIYAMPPVAAAPYAPLLGRAVEVIDLETTLRALPHDAVARFFAAGASAAGLPPPLRAAVAAREAHAAHAPLPPASGNPRAPSIEYWTLQSDLKRRIPDGWSEGVAQAISASTRTDLQAEADAFVARYPTHPLADMARLAKVRVSYFAGDLDAAWSEAMSLYPRRRVRALAEMRYLLLQGHAPSPSFLARVTDPELATALTMQDGIEASRWPSLWRASEGMPAGDVRVNLQERLLAWQAAKIKPGLVPASFPDRPRVLPSALWGKLRALALLRAGEADKAIDQLAAVPADAERDLLLAQAQIAAGRPDRAIELPSVGDDVRAYLLGVRADDATVTRLCQSGAPVARAPACFELAVRMAQSGRWSEAIPFVRAGMPSRVALWQQAARLAAASGPDHDLAWARFLGGHAGELVSIVDRGPYRGISAIDERLAPGAPEHARIEAMLMRTTEQWLALESYVRWLARNESHRSARDVLAEADDAYNRLVNFGGGDYYFWGRWATKTTTAADLRRVGAVIRQRR